jgi:hypothetical protein
MAEHYAAQADVERVLKAATLAANYAWLAPIGLLSDVRLERTVVHAVRGSGRVTVDGDRRGGRVLHVLSEAYAIGGHTRQVARWMDRDERISDVVLTNQRSPVPDRLVESVRATGGDLHDLRSTTPGLLDRARALRRQMDRADLVVLTVHSYDAVALAAVNLPGARPPVIWANHGDHTFWLGVASADLLCDMRPQARALDVALRSVPDERIGLLPLPVAEMPSGSGDAIREELGIRPDAIVAVTVTDDWKVAAAWGRGMHQILDRALHWSPQLSIVLVGVSPNADWARLGKRYPGRVFPVGRVVDPAPYFALADVYVDSYPNRSPTSSLEAAVLGLPIVALADIPEDDFVHIFQAASPGLTGLPRAETVEQFAVALRRLVLDPDRRRREGAAARDSVLAVHDGSGWRAQLESLYEQARRLPAGDVDDLAESPTDDRYGAMLLSAVHPSPASPDPRQLTGPLGELFDSRMRSDLQAAVSRDLGPSFRVRVGSEWHEHEEWTTRLLELCSTHPRLSVSLPFLPDDELRGDRTEACLIALLARTGRTAEDCGDVSVDSRRPPQTGPEFTGELPFTDEALDWLEGLVSSPLWSASAGTGHGRSTPEPMVSASA